MNSNLVAAVGVMLAGGVFVGFMAEEYLQQAVASEAGTVSDSLIIIEGGFRE